LIKIRLTWAGKTKEKFINEGIEKYLKLLRPYADVSITQIKEEKGTDTQKMIEKESVRIAKAGVPYILLDEKGRSLSSIEFAGLIDKNKPSLHFVLGGAFGVSEKIKKEAKDIISLSKMTFTHEMARLFFLEQTYRAFTIINKRGYHH